MSVSTELIQIKKEDDLSRLKIERGSRLAIQRPGYQHWAVYLGDGKVCHLTEDKSAPASTRSGRISSALSSATIHAVVVVESFTDMMGGGNSTVYVDNSADIKWSPLKPDEIVRRAYSRVGPSDYNVIRGNCEHFVNWCRYGKDESDQVTGAIKAVKMVFTGSS